MNLCPSVTDYRHILTPQASPQKLWKADPQGYESTAAQYSALAQNDDKAILPA